MAGRRKGSIKIALIFPLFIAALLISVGLSPAAQAEQADVNAAAQAGEPVFSDLSADNPLWPYVRYLVDQGILQGYPDSTFQPGGEVTRAELAKVLVLAKNIPLEAQTATVAFSDVAPEHWAFREIQAAARSGLLQGYPNGTCSPDAAVTRAEAAAVLLRLSGGALSAKDETIADVPGDHWAYRQIATAVQSGMARLSSDNSFYPDLPFNRGDLARSVTFLYTTGPALRNAPLAGQLTVQKGGVKVTEANGDTRKFEQSTQVSAGVKITTGEGALAELVFDDGSGLLIDSKTELTITKADGLNYMRQDGSPGITVDKLAVSLTTGRIIGALASRYETSDQTNGQTTTTSKTSYQGIHKTKENNQPLLASSSAFSTLPLLPAVNEETAGSQDLAWWQEAATERERVVVDMPWGVASVRGTFWMNEVSAAGQNTAVLTGHAIVTSAGQSVSLTTNQTTAITSSAVPPAPPAPISPAQAQVLNSNQAFILNRAQEIQNNLPPVQTPAILTPVENQQTIVEQVQQQNQPAQQEQQQQVSNIIGIVTQSLAQATAGVFQNSTTTQNNNVTNPIPPTSDSSPYSVVAGAVLPAGTLTQPLTQTLAGGAVSLTLPAGIELSPGAGVIVKVLKATPSLPAGLSAVGHAVDINITGLPAGTSVPVTLRSAQDKQDVAIYYYNPSPGCWEYQNSTVDQTNWTVTAAVEHFSIYAVFEDTTSINAPMLTSPADYSAPVAGTASGTTRIVTLNLIAGATEWRVKVQNDPYSVPALNSTVAGAVYYSAGADLAAGAGQHLLLLATDNAGKIKGYADITISAGQIAGGINPAISASRISAGYFNTIFVKENGTVMAFGQNDSGQLGDGTTAGRQTPVEVQGLSGVTAVAGAYQHTIALKNDGTVWAWGANGAGQLGDGTTTGRHTPAQVQGLSGVTAIAAGGGHSLAVKDDGTIWAWGNNGWGELGDGTTDNRSTPVQVQGLTNIVAVAGRWDFSLALKNDGTVWAWGANGSGQLGDGTTIDKQTPVEVQGLSGVIAIAGGHDHTVALKSDGTVWAYGRNAEGQLGDGTNLGRYTPVQVQNLTGVVAIEAGGCHSLAIKDDGTVWAWGNNGNGQLGDGTTDNANVPGQVQGLSGGAAITAGECHTVALKNDGTVWVCGRNIEGQLGDGTTNDRHTLIQVQGLN